MELLDVRENQTVRDVKMQSKRMSFIESLTNVIVGYLVAVGANYIVLPMFGYMVSVADSFYIGIVFMVIAIVRSYILRRMFNGFCE